MDFKEQTRVEYNDRFKLFENARSEVAFIIDSFISKSRIKIHSVQSRIKEFDSLIKKADSLDIHESSKVFELIQDIVGLRIICLFISDINEIAELLNKHFEIILEDNKLNGSEISSFGYFSAHYICRLRKDYNGARYDEIKNLIFEIQVRIISMDAWANISHYLDYKSEVEIPEDLKKDFFALSGLFYVADTHFEMFFKNKKEHSKSAKKDLAKDFEREINFETVQAYLEERFKRRGTATQFISGLVQEINASGYRTIKDLDDKLNIAFKKTPESKFSNHLNQVGMVRTALRDSDPKYKQTYEEKYLKKKKK